MDGRPVEASTLHDYVRILRRRKWIVLQAVLLVPAAAVVLSLRQEKLYQASADVLLSRSSISSQVTNTQDPTAFIQADEFIATQGEVARSPVVAKRTVRALGLKGRTAGWFLAASSVGRKGSADVISFRFTDHDPALAMRAATEYARQYTKFRQEVDTAAIHRALTEVQQRIGELENAGDRKSRLYTSLVDKEQQLRTLEALQTSNAYPLKDAQDAPQVQPTPVRNGLFGLGFGILLGVGLAFLWEALDTRIRSAEELNERLRLPLLGRLPEPPRRLRREDKLVMLEDPTGVEAEAFRVLRTNIEFANLERAARVLMVSSALEQEGKSTTVANLAVAMARAGQRVILVDLDLRRPYLDRFFGLLDQPGVTHVALGKATLDQALAPITITTPGQRSGTAGANGHGKAHGVLEVLTSGPIPPDAGEFVGSRTLGDILDQLRERADFVLVDSPPLLQVGDAITLSAFVDALVVVANLRVSRRNTVRELSRVLDASPAPTVGFVVTGAHLESGYGYGGYYGRAYARREPAPASVE